MNLNKNYYKLDKTFCFFVMKYNMTFSAHWMSLRIRKNEKMLAKKGSS